jgi:hypothetical protein
MVVSPMLVADLQWPEAVEQGERPFDHPPAASRAVLGIDTTAGDAADDEALRRLRGAAQGEMDVVASSSRGVTPAYFPTPASRARAGHCVPASQGAVRREVPRRTCFSPAVRSTA